MTNHKAKLLRKIRERTAVVGVVGLGYVGLPFAVEKAKVGFRVKERRYVVERISSGKDGLAQSMGSWVGRMGSRMHASRSDPTNTR